MMPYLIAGLGYGDEGKGATCEALVRKTHADLVVRYNGGPQCAHNVVTLHGKHHTFSQFGSGTLEPTVSTYLSRFVLISPIAMLIESDILEDLGISDTMSRMFVDERCLVITPFQKALNRLTEISRGDKCHGSTGSGVGQTRQDHLEYGDNVLFAGDIPIQRRLTEKLEFLRDRCREAALNLTLPKNNQVDRELSVFTSASTIPWYLSKYNEWRRRVNLVTEVPITHGRMIFEGAQGMLIDETHGFQPHTTWTDITFANAETILRETGYTGPTHKVGVLRTYHTRHGAGPFPSEAPELKDNIYMKEEYNENAPFTGAFRLGHFDLPLALYALHAIKGIDSLALNHIDVANKSPRMGVRISKDETIYLSGANLPKFIEDQLKVKISIEGAGPTYHQRSFTGALADKQYYR